MELFCCCCFVFEWYRSRTFAANFHSIKGHSRANLPIVLSLTEQENQSQAYLYQLKAAFPGGSKMKGSVPV